MSTKKELSFPLIIIAIVIGGTLYKQIDFKTMTVKDPAMAVIYALTLLMTLYFIFKRNATEK